ncbi:MAG TPA: FtsX-like permease family protein [Gemmatimonadales bacterium]|jgi:hypothetical protein|nr:FtsX-like permease family protein [Gemmatimonadales bacterium]
MLPILSPVADGLRRTWKSALVVTVVGAAAIAMVMAVRALLAGGAAHLALPSIAPLGDVIQWTGVAAPPDVARSTALTTMLQLLQATAWAALGVAFISILSRYLVQSIERGPEIAIRRAVGASRVQVLLAQLLEGGILAWLMWLLAIVAAAAVLAWHTSSWPGRALPASLALMLPALLALLLVAVAVLAPLSYSSAQFLVHPPEGRAGLRIPTFQLALSLAVLITGAMLLRQGRQLEVKPGALRPPRSVVVHFDSGIADPALRAERYQALLDRVRRAPGVDSATLSGEGELLGLGTEEFTMSDCGICPRGGIALPLLTFHATYRAVSTGALASHDRLEQGRFFSDADQWDTARVVVVNHHLAQRYYQDGKPLGKDIYLGANSQRHPYTVVGVVADEPSAAIGGRLQPREVVYLPVSQHPPASAELVVGTTGGSFGASAESAAAGRTYRRLVIDTLGDGARITSISTASAILGQEGAAIRWFARRFGFVGMVIFLVALVGTFDTMRMWLRGLSHELAIRRAVGATRRSITWWVLARAAWAGIAGTALGVFLYLTVMMPAVTELMNGVPVWDGRVAATSAALLVAAMMAGATVPLYRMLRQPVAGGLG